MSPNRDWLSDTLLRVKKFCLHIICIRKDYKNQQLFFEESFEENMLMKNDPLEWEEIKSEHIVRDEWIDFRRSAFRLPDGSVFEPFYT